MNLRLLVPALSLLPLTAAAQLTSRRLMPIEFEHSAEFGWLKKPVLASRVLDDMTRPAIWRLTGTATLTFPDSARMASMRVLRVDMQMFRGTPAPTRNRLSTVNIQRDVAGEDWSGYNRLSMWVRADYSGVPAVPLIIALRNEGVEKVPDRYGREGMHHVTLEGDGWQQVVWEIDPIPRDRITRLEVGYFVNRMLAGPTDRVAFEIGRLELQKVEPDHHTGWNVAPGRIAFSHTGYQSGSSKTAIASDLKATEFELVKVDDTAFGEIVLRRPVRAVKSVKGEFQELDFSEVNAPGRYVLRAGSLTTRPFTIGPDVWKGTIWKALNFFYGNRCGFDVPGVHGVDHVDWFAVDGRDSISMSGGWHDAGDLSQGVINTGEAAYAMFALAERLDSLGQDAALVERLLEEARWGLHWVLKLRFPSGARVAFGSHNYWTNNVVGDADDRVVVAKNNPNANYVAAAVEAQAYRVLRKREPALAARALRTAELDWQQAIVGVEDSTTRHTPAFAATRMELASIGITASLELYRATGKQLYADKAVELGRVVLASQQVAPVGSSFPLSGFLYTGPDKDTLFHQFHRGNDQAPVVALSQLITLLPKHAERASWYAAIERYAEYQKKSASTTAPYGVLPSYVYRLTDSAHVPVSGGPYGGNRAAYVAQVRAGLPMGDGWYLRAMPVVYARRGNYGPLLSQAKALAVASALRGDSAGMDLAQRQLQWVVGRNPFVQSTMYGEGYDWSQQYSVSSGDLVGSLPVGMQSFGDTDLPYWSGQNMFVYKEVWVHSSSRWIWIMEQALSFRNGIHGNGGKS
jgi:hypothetical protein